VERIARDDKYFTFLRECRANVKVVLGDARLSLPRMPDHHYNLIILDAFSSDAIPVHLITREALKVYASKLAPHGLLVFHISNRYLDLSTVLGDLAKDANLACLIQEDLKLSEAERTAKKTPSVWVVMGHSLSDMDDLIKDRRWKPLPGGSGAKLWTDDFSNILSVFKSSSFRMQIEQIKRFF
jgi:hypothetical protein